mgnify:CR=1 FL=1
MSKSSKKPKFCRGMVCRVTCVTGDGDHVCRLLDLGLTPGTEFSIVKVAPLGDPVEIDVRGARLCLRRRETQGLDFEQVERSG